MATICPGCTEVVNDGIDQDCVAGDVCYEDFDNDNFVDNGSDTVVSADLDCLDSGEHTATTTADCDDTESTVCPGCTEVADDDIDQDCDSRDDLTCYLDDDGDNYGLTGDSLVQTSTVDLPATQICPGGRHATPGDCNDSVNQVNPGVTLNNASTGTATACQDSADTDDVCLGGGRDLNLDGDCEDANEDMGALSSGFRADCDETNSTDEAKIDFADNDGDTLIDELCYQGNELVVTEYYSDSSGTEPDWFEVQNKTWFDVDMRSWDIGDGTTIEAIPNSTTPVSVGARGIICHGATATITCDRTLSTLVLEDPTGAAMTTVITLTTGGFTVDSMDADAVFSATATASTSMQVDDDELDDEFVPSGNEPDNDTGAQWCESLVPDTWGGGVGTPGSINRDCP